MSPLVAYDDDDDDEKTDVQDSGDGNNVPNVKSALNDETSYKRGRFRAPKTRKHHEQELATSVPQNFSKCKQVIAVELAAADDNSLSEESSMRDHKLADHEHVSLRSVLPPPKRAKIGPKPSLTDAHKSTKSTSPYLKSTHSDKPPDEESSTSASISAPRIQNAPLMPLRVSRKIKSRSAPMAEDELAEPLIPIPMAQPMKDFTAVSDSSDKLKLHDEGSYIPMIYNGESDGALAVDAYYAENFDSNAAELSGTSIEKQLPQHEMAIPVSIISRFRYCVVFCLVDLVFEPSTNSSCQG